MSQEGPPAITVTRFDDMITKFWVNGYVYVILLRCDGENVLLDSGFEETAEQLVQKLREMGVNRITLLINTHADRDHTGGNALLGAESTIIAHANCRQTLTEREGFPESGLPTMTLTDSMSLSCGKIEVELLAMPGGHTNGDIVVHLPGSKVVHLGDIIVPDSFPVVWLEYGREVGVERLSEVLEHLIKLFPDDTRFLAAHGRDYTMHDLKAYHDMVVQTVRRVRRAMDEGKTVEEMRENDVLSEWESWNSTEYDWLDTDYWIEVIYRSLRR